MIGSLISEYRIKNGFTVRNLALKLSVDNSLITLWEKNRRKPSVRNHKNICDLLSLDPITLEPIQPPTRSAWDEFDDNQPRHCIKGMTEAVDYTVSVDALIEKYKSELKQIPSKEDE